MFFRFLATTLGIAFSLTLIVGTLTMADNATRPVLAEADPESDMGHTTPTPAATNPTGASAVTDTSLQILDATGKPGGARNTLIPATGTEYTVGGDKFRFNIREPKLGDIPFLLLWIVEFLVGLGGVVAVFYLIYGGFQYFYELRHPSGSPSSGKGTIYHAILGLVIIMISYIFIATIVGGITGY